MIAAFTDGETRLVYAARSDDPSGTLTFLVDDTADEMRAFTRAHLRCFVSDCPTPQFTTVSRRGRRDGFRHLTGGGHSEESLFHKQGKHALLDWLARQHPDIDARPEVSLLPVVDRRADVLATYSTRARVALEVQYSGLEVAHGAHSWAARTRDYRDAGVAPVWFLGHRGVHFTPMLDGTVAIGSVARAILDAGMPLWWLNPILGSVAVPYVVAHAGDLEFNVPPTGQDRCVRLWIEPLDSFRLTEDGVHHPLLDYLAEQREAFETAEAERREREERRAAEARVRAEQEKMAATRAQDRADEGRARRAMAVQTAIEAENATWESSTMRANVLSQHGGQLPAYLDLPSTGAGIHANRQHWQATVYGYVMHNKVGTTGTIDDCLRSLAGQHIRYNPRDARETVRLWVKLLDERGHVLLDPSAAGRFTVTDPPVELARRAMVADEERRARGEVAAETRRVQVARTHAREAVRERLSRDNAALPPRDQQATVPATPESATRMGPIATHCRVCGTPLDAFIAKQGIAEHSGCHGNVRAGSTSSKLASASRRRLRTCRGCANALPSDFEGLYHVGCIPWQVRRAAHETNQTRDGHRA